MMPDYQTTAALINRMAGRDEERLGNANNRHQNMTQFIRPSELVTTLSSHTGHYRSFRNIASTPAAARPPQATSLASTPAAPNIVWGRTPLTSSIPFDRCKPPDYKTLRSLDTIRLIWKENANSLFFFITFRFSNFFNLFFSVHEGEKYRFAVWLGKAY